MGTMNYYDIIRKPVITEKSMSMMGEKRYAFSGSNQDPDR